MSNLLRIDSMCELDVHVVRANIRAPRRMEGGRCLIAVRRGDQVHVRNAVQDPGGVTVINMARTYYPLVRNDGVIPHRKTGVSLRRLEGAGFREHRRPFQIDRDLPNVVVDTTEDDFNRWWRRSYYPGCDLYGFLKAQRRLTPRESLIRQYYQTHGYRWTPVRMRKLAKEYGTDIESLCAAVRLPIHIFAWYEELYREDPCNIPRPVTNLLGPAFLVLDLLRGMKHGAAGSVFYPFADLRSPAPQPLQTKTGRAA